MSHHVNIAMYSYILVYKPSWCLVDGLLNTSRQNMLLQTTKFQVKQKHVQQLDDLKQEFNILMKQFVTSPFHIWRQNKLFQVDITYM